MKKILILLIILFITTPVFAEVFFEPEWKEFCPKKYSQIDSNRFHYTSSGRYWAERKRDFEKRLERCNKFSDSSKEACYSQIREIENNLTQNYNSNKNRKALRYLMYNSVF